MSAAMLTVLPVILLFFFTQRTFLQGLTFLKNTEAN
jgi:ABC-type glycerol-3-phosphate transport system permease component